MRTRFACLAALLVLATPLPASSQLFRAYVSGHGSDTNPCTLAAPCRLLPAALAAVANGGDIWMLDSANYNTGPVNIAKSVTILAVPGAQGSLVALGGNAIDIGQGNISVTLRNLNVVPFTGNSNHNGISLTASSTVTLLKCAVYGFNGNNARGLTAASDGANVVIVDSVFSGNYHGVWIENAARLQASRSGFDANAASGIVVNSSASGTVASITSSTLNNNASAGVLVNQVGTSETAQAAIRNSQIAGNGVGISVFGAGARAIVTDSQISDNSTGVMARETGAHVVLQGNLMDQNVTGITIFNSAEAVMKRNSLVHNSTGFSVFNSGMLYSLSDNVVSSNGSYEGAFTAATHQ